MSFSHHMKYLDPVYLTQKFTGHQIGAFCGAYIGGLEYDATGSYVRMWYASLALAIFAGCANLLASDKSLRGHHPQPIKEIDEETA